MKILILTGAFLFQTLAHASGCPVLKGEYNCLLSPERLTLLTVNQWEETNKPGLMNYTFKYQSIGGDPEITGIARKQQRLRGDTGGERDRRQRCRHEYGSCPSSAP